MAAEVLEELGMEREIFLLSHDLTSSIRKYLRKGTINMTIGQDSRLQGYRAVEILANMLLIDFVQPEKILLGMKIAVAENESFLEE